MNVQAGAESPTELKQQQRPIFNANVTFCLIFLCNFLLEAISSSDESMSLQQVLLHGHFLCQRLSCSPFTGPGGIGIKCFNIRPHCMSPVSNIWPEFAFSILKIFRMNE